MIFSKSFEYLARAEKLIPSCSQTFSKGPNQWARGVSPHYLTRGEGAWVWDADGNKFLDYLMALGPIILGYGNKYVNDAAKNQIDEGVTFSQMHPLEVELSELLVDLIPCAEMIRFGKNGSDATTAAVRVARAYTGRDRVGSCGYHGWHDWYIGTTTRSRGVPDVVQSLSHTFPYNDLASLEKLFTDHPGEFAAIIMEPTGVEAPNDGYLEGVKKLCNQHGVVLIFDEIVNGFRMRMGGAQEYFGVIPDIACFGKAMGNGFPISAVVGHKDLMKTFDDIFFSGTFGGEAVSLAACKATIQFMLENNVVQKNWSFSRKLSSGISALIKQHQMEEEIIFLGYDVRSVLGFPQKDEYQTRLRRTYFMQECVKRGLLYFCSHIPCFSHSEEELNFTLSVLSEVMEKYADVAKNNSFEMALEGPCIEAIFRKA
ncbi:aminotransferase class III-fold pyridoxal phosphate-dependent enzyme [Kiloniella majae]|uniref:aminotransferase class III-fold pyridoxal phosphate-dependent enzyme n=1 Tax=Kiloniella majae TaxID=1938558 RepID=UPI000A279166|nr:aminotransferase class III-fold pyridoxal phosphate-dependent enzyme [Kiloniella majae]